MKYFDTFAELSATKQTKIGDRFVCIERANAEYVLQPAGYVALPGDVIFSNGLVGRLQFEGSAKAEFFSSLSDAIERSDSVTVNKDTEHDGISIQRNNVTISSNNKSSLIYTGSTGDGITIGNSTISIDGVALNGLSIKQKIEATSGSSIHIINASRIRLDDLYITDPNIAVDVDGIARSEFTDIWIRKESGRSVKTEKCFWLKKNPTSGLDVVNLKMTRCDGVSSDGLGDFIYIESSDWITIVSCHANLADSFMVIEHGNNNIWDVWVTDCYMDEAYSSNVIITGAGGGFCGGIKFSNTYFRYAADYGLLIDGTGIIKDVAVSGRSKFSQSGIGAVNITNNSVSEFDICDSSIGDSIGSAGAQPTIYTSALRNSISQCTFVNNSSSVDILAERPSLSGSLIVSNNTMHTSGSPSKVLNNNFAFVNITDNIGVQDFPLRGLAGSSLFTSDASGVATISHSLGYTPSYVDCQLRSLEDKQMRVTAITDTDFTVYVWTPSTGAPAAVSRTAYYNLF